MLLFCKFRINNYSDLSYGIDCECECRKEHRNLNFIVLLHSKSIFSFCLHSKRSTSSSSSSGGSGGGGGGGSSISSSSSNSSDNTMTCFYAK